MSPSPQAWRLRPAVPADADVLCALERRAFGARSWGADSVRGSFAAAGVFVILGEANESAPVESAPRGFVMWRDLGGEAEILTLGVIAEARRAGLGERLLGEAIKAACAAGARRMFLEVDAGNDAAAGLYRKGGFVEAGVRKGYYRDGADAVVMARALVSAV